MNRNETRSGDIRDGLHLVILISLTITTISVLIETLTKGWEKAAVPLVLACLVYSWCISLLQKFSGVQRVWLYAVFMMFCYSFYGMHQTSFDIFTAAGIVIILIFVMTRIRVLVWMVVFTYYFTMFFNLVKIRGNIYEAYQMTRAEMILSLFLMMLSGFVAHFFISERNVEFNRHMQEMEEMNRQKDLAKEQIRIISREIGTLTRNLQGNLLLLKEELPAGERMQIYHIGSVMEKELTDLSDYEEMLSGKLENRAEMYEITNILTQLKMERLIGVEERKVDLIIDLDPHVPKILVGDWMKILKILRHLISNGLRYTKEGGVQVRIYSRTHGDEFHLCIDVNDTGMGIEQTELEHLLEQLNERRNSGYHPGGLGLGLYLVTGFVNCMGGFFQIESEWGIGTRVSISIPQRVSDAVPCISLNEKNRMCLVYENYDYENKLLNEYYEAFFRHFTDNLGLDAYAISGLAQLQELTKRYQKVCLLTERAQYDARKAYYEDLDPKDVYLIVLTAEHEAFAEEGIAHPLEKPLGTMELLHALGRAEKTIDRRAHKDEYTENPMLHAETLPEREIRQHSRKVLIVTDSMADLPPEISRSRGIPVIPFRIFTEHSTFLDGVEISQECALSYMKHNPGMHSMAPEEADFRDFFERNLRFAGEIIYISTAKRVSVAYERAVRVALQMEHVTVFNSGQVSGGVALMALYADTLARGDRSVREIIRALEELRPKVKTTFLIENLDHLAYVGRVSKGLGILARTLMLHPVMTMRHDSMKIKYVLLGQMRIAKELYIRRILRHRDRINGEYVFVGSVGIGGQEMTGLKQLLLTEGKFQTVIMRHASAAISINCGVGTFGIIYIEN